MSSEGSSSGENKKIVPVYVEGGEDVVTIPVYIGSNVVTRVVYSPVVTVPVTVVVASRVEVVKEEEHPGVATRVVEKTTTTPVGGEKEEGYDPGELITRINRVESELRSVIDELRSKGYSDEDEEVRELYALRGDLRAWREEIAKYAVENKKVPSDVAYKLELFLSAVMKRIEKARGLPAKNTNPEYHIRRLKEVDKQLYEYYWKLKELGVPSSMEIMIRINELRKEIREWIRKLEKYKESGKTVSREEIAVLDKLFNSAKEAVSDADFIVKTKKLYIDVAINETVYEAFMKYYLDDVLDQAYLVKAQLYSIASYLKREHFNILREAIDNAINVLLEIKNKIRRSGEKLSEEDISKVVLAKGTIDNIMSLFAIIISRHTGLDPSKLLENDIYKRLMQGDKELFMKLYREYKKILNECLEEHNERYCWSNLGRLLKEKGFPLTKGDVEIFFDVFNYYDLLRKGKEIETPLTATASWVLDDITDYIYFPMVFGAQGRAYFKKLADETNDPVLKALYLMLSQASFVGGAFATGVWVFLINTLTAGAAAPVFIGASLTKLAKEMNYYFSDPLAQQEWNSFIEAVKKGDREAILMLTAMVAAAIAGYVGAKLPSEIRVNDFLTLDQWLTLKMGEAFTKLADKASMMGFTRLANVFRSMASRYQLKIAGVSNAELSTKNIDIRITTDDRGSLIIKIFEKGRIKGEKISFKIDPQMIKRFAGLAKLRSDETTKAILKYIETVLKSSDDFQEVSKQLQFLDDLYDLVKQSKIASEDLKAILDALKNGAKVRVTGPVYVSGKESYGYIIKTQGWLEVIRNDPKAPVTRIVYEFNPQKGYILKPVQVYGDVVEKLKVATVKDLEKIFGVTGKELYRVLNEALGHPEKPLAVISTENNQIILDLYHQLTIVTPKGALQAVSGNNFFLKMGDKVVRVLGSEFKRTMFVDPKSKYVMEEIVRIPLSDDIASSLRLDALKNALEVAVKMFKQGKPIDEIVNTLSDVTKVSIASEQGRQFLMQLAAAAQQLAKTGVVPDAVIPVVLSSTSGTGATLSVVVGTSASALSQLAKSLSSQQARDLVLSVKEKTGIEEVTAESLAKTLGISVEAAETIIEKASEAKEQEPREVVVTQVFETTIIAPQQVKTVTIVSELEEPVELTRDIEIPVIEVHETIPVTIVLPQEVKHVVLPKTIEEQVELVVDTEIPVVEATETVHKTVVVPPQPRTKTIVVEKEETTTLPVDDRVEIIYITIPKTVTVVVPAYLEKWIPVEEAQPQPQPPPGKTTPAPPTPLPGVPAPPNASLEKKTFFIKRGKQYETVKI